MVKIIETTLRLDLKDNFEDFQSRVIEVESWDSYVDEIKNAKCVTRTACLGSLMGCTLPKLAIIENLFVDENHLHCHINNGVFNGMRLSYLIG